MSTSALVETLGLLVSSENVTVMVSPSVNPAVSPPAIMETISGPSIGPALSTVTVGATADPVADDKSVTLAVTVCTPKVSTALIVPPVSTSGPVISDDHRIEAVKSPSSKSLAVAMNICESPSLIVTEVDGTDMVTSGNALTVTLTKSWSFSESRSVCLSFIDMTRAVFTMSPETSAVPVILSVTDESTARLGMSQIPVEGL